MEVVNRVSTTSTTGGTGVMTVSTTAHVALRSRPLSDIPVNTAGVVLLIEDEAGTDWELSECTILSPSTFSRDKVLKGSNGTAKVNFTAGTPKSIQHTVSAEMYNDFARISEGMSTSELQPASGLTGAFRIPGVDTAGSDVIATLSAIAAAVAILIGSGAPPTDSRAPVLQSMVIPNAAKSTIVLTFDEALNADAPALNTFSLQSGRTVTAIAITGLTVTLTVSAAYAYGVVERLTYNKPTTNPLKDATNNEAANIAAVLVTNNIAAPVGTPATGFQLSGATAGTVGTPSGDFTVDVVPIGGALPGGSTLVTPNSGNGGGTFTPASLTLTDAVPSGKFKYTPAATGVFAIGVTNDDGLANPANINYTASAAPVQTPGQVTALVAGTVTENSVALAWSAPTGNPVTDYVIEYALAGSGNWAVFADGVSTAASTTVTGLAAGQNYDFRVTAANGSGNGPVSDIVTKATAAAVPVVEYTIAPTAGYSTLPPATFSVSANAHSYNYEGTAGKGFVAARTNTAYFTVKVKNTTTNGPATAFGWSTSDTDPPAIWNGTGTNPNVNAENSINMATKVTVNGAGSFPVSVLLWIPTGFTGKMHLWVKPENGAWQCLNPAGMQVVA